MHARSISASGWLQPCEDMPADRRDLYSWARASNVYLPQAELEAALAARSPEVSAVGQVLVLDVRDSDAVGGHVAGALHYPDTTFARRLPELMSLLAIRQPSLVVLHCMESIRRGPRCAYQLRERLEQAHRRRAQATNVADGLASTDAAAAISRLLPPPHVVRVLNGGADQWLRKNWRNACLVEEYDDRFWGFQMLQELSAARALERQQHSLYTRPADQRAPSPPNKSDSDE
jgi:rhodanese-related sulfurtransferase